MSLTACGEFCVRTDGDDSFGGGFNQHRTNGGFSAWAGLGTDRSNASSAFVVLDGATITASNGGTGATITISGYTVVTADLGNYVKITAGTNFTAGTYEITAVNTGSNTWTLDTNCTSGAGSAMVGKMGGSRLTIASAVAVAVASQVINIKSGTYTLTSAIAWSSKGLGFSGFGTTKHDYGTRPLITTATNSTVLFAPTSGFGVRYIFSNMSFSNTAVTRANGMTAGQGTFILDTCLFDGFVAAIDPTAVASIEYQIWTNCEIKNCTVNSTTSGAVWSNPNDSNHCGLVMRNCFVHDNTGNGIYLKSQNLGFSLQNCLITNNGTNGVKCDVSQPQGHIIRCTIANNTTNGLNFTAGMGAVQIEENIFYGNTTTGILAAFGSGTDYIILPLFYRNNAFGSNGTNVTTGVTTGTNPITLTADPFTNAASKDYTLNSTVGGGASLKGISADFVGLTDFQDIGAMQTAGTAPSGTYRIAVSDPLTAR
jgi:hypothetical protein